jgi:hypothetical protein
VSRPALGPTQPPVQWVPGVVSPGVKARPGRDAYHLPPSSAQVVNEYELYLLSPQAPPWRVEGLLCFTFYRPVQNILHSFYVGFFYEVRKLNHWWGSRVWPSVLLISEITGRISTRFGTDNIYSEVVVRILFWFVSVNVNTYFPWISNRYSLVFWQLFIIQNVCAYTTNNVDSIKTYNVNLKQFLMWNISGNTKKNTCGTECLCNAGLCPNIITCSFRWGETVSLNCDHHQALLFIPKW